MSKYLVSVLVAASIGIPAYAFNWSVDVDRRVKINDGRVQALIDSLEREREIDKEYRTRQEARAKVLVDDIKQILLVLPRR